MTPARQLQSDIVRRFLEAGCEFISIDEDGTVFLKGTVPIKPKSEEDFPWIHHEGQLDEWLIHCDDRDGMIFLQWGNNGFDEEIKRLEDAEKFLKRQLTGDGTQR